MKNKKVLFSCQEQLNNDLWNAVYTILPVIDLIRSKGRNVWEEDYEINQYLSYTDTFSKISYEHYKYLMDNWRSKSSDSRVLQALILLSINHGIKEQEREKIRKSLDKFYHGYNMFFNKSEDIRKNYINYIATHF